MLIYLIILQVRSTDTSRTILSALSQLQGLYPEGTGPIMSSNLSDYLTIPPYINAQSIDIGQ